MPKYTYIIFLISISISTTIFNIDKNQSIVKWKGSKSTGSSHDGLILIEVPDYQKSINKLDYTMIWEEHLFYYTKETFINSINENNFKLLQTIKRKYPSEDVLIGIIKKS